MQIRISRSRSISNYKEIDAFTRESKSSGLVASSINTSAIRQMGHFGANKQKLSYKRDGSEEITEKTY